MQDFLSRETSLLQELRSLFAGNRRQAARIAKFDPVRCQSISRSQTLREALIYVSDESPKKRKIMGLGEFNLMAYEYSLEEFFGCLLSVKPYVVVIFEVSLEEDPCGLQVPLGFPQPLLYEVPSHLVRSSHTAPDHACVPDRQDRQ